jgi:hypothetical protein
LVFLNNQLGVEVDMDFFLSWTWHLILCYAKSVKKRLWGLAFAFSRSKQGKWWMSLRFQEWLLWQHHLWQFERLNVSVQMWSFWEESTSWIVRDPKILEQ